MSGDSDLSGQQARNSVWAPVKQWGNEKQIGHRVTGQFQCRVLSEHTVDSRTRKEDASKRPSGRAGGQGGGRKEIGCVLDHSSLGASGVPRKFLTCLQRGRP